MNPSNIIEKGMVQWRIILTFCVILVAFGIYSFFTMPRQEFPDFTIRQGLVVGIMPGATSKEVELQLAKPVEEYLFSFNEVNKSKTYSLSKEGQLFVFVELVDEVKGPDAPAFWAKLRHGLNELRAQKLPGQVLALIGNNDFGDTSAVLFTIVGDGKSPRELLKYLEVLESHLRRIDATSKLRRYGTQDEVIRVTISRDRLSRYGIRPLNVWTSLQGVGAVPAPARLDGDDIERPIHVTKVLRSESELGDTIILSAPNGPVVRLKDVAEIKREYGHDDAFVRYNGKTAILLSIEMHSGNDITAFGKKVDLALKDTLRELPPGITISRVADQPFVVKTSVGHFIRDFGLAIVSVILVTMLFLPIRIAAVAAISIPICVAITMAVLNALGVKLEMVSLAGLVLVLGMVVDNAIVVIDDYVVKLDGDLDPWTAAWKSGRQLMWPVFSATAAIILSFVPMPFIMTGQAADFVGSLPVTVAVALTTSMLVAFFLVPIMDFWLIKRGLKRNVNRRSFLDHLQHFFDRGLDAAFRRPWLTIAVGVCSVVIAIVIARGIPEQLFPKVDRNQFAVEVYLPSGRSLKETDYVIRRIEQELLADKRVLNVTSFVGQSSPRFHTVYAPKMPSRNYGQLLVNTVDESATEEVLHEKQEKLRGAFPEAYVLWKQLVLSLGSPVEVRFSGNNIEDLKRVARQVEEYAKTIPGTTRVSNDYEEALQIIDVVPDTDACSRLGVPTAMLQMSLALGTQGFPVATIWEDDYPVRVLLKDESRDASTMEGLKQQYVSSALAAATVPLEQLASVKPSWQDGSIVRRNGVRTITVKLDIGIGVLGSSVQNKIEPFVNGLKLPPGVRVEYGGDKELAKETLVPQTKSMILSIALIFLAILIQFKRFRQTLLVMLSMPLSILGAFFGLLVMGYPFGMTAFMGITGLLGIVIRNGIILISYAEDLRKEQGLGVREAALAAGKRRMRPIYLTSMAAAIGVVPMILSRSTLWGPFGTVTCFGLIFAMVLTLFVLPVAYWLILKGDDKAPKTATKSAAVATVVLAAVLMANPAAASAKEVTLTLDKCKELTLEYNPSVKEDKLEKESAKQMRKAVFTKYFPQMSASWAGYAAVQPMAKMNMSGGDLPVYDGNPANIPLATQFAYFPASSIGMAQQMSLGMITAIQPVFAGGRILNGNRLAELGVEITEDKAVLTRRQVLKQVEEKYWRLVTLAEKKKTLTAYETLLAAIEKQVSDARKAGLITNNDELKVAVQRSRVEAEAERLDEGIRLAERDLIHHMGLPDNTTIILTDTLSVPENPDPLEKLKDGAVDRRPELKLLEKVSRAEHLQTKLKIGEMLPSVSIGGSLLALNVQGMDGSLNAMVFGMVNVPINAIWEGVYNVASQRSKEEAANLKYRDTGELLNIQIDKAWSDLKSAWRMSQVADKTVTQAEANVKEAADRHANGLATISEVLEAQVILRQVQDSRTDSRAEYWLNRSEFLRSAGKE